MNRTRQTGLRRVVVALVCAVATVATASVVSAGPAAAAPTCTYSACNGEDPEYMGCARDAVVLDEFTYQTVRVKLNISYRCNAYWAKFENPLGGQPGYQWVILVLWNLQQGGSIVVTLTTRVQTDTKAWYSGYTAMWNNTQYWGQACMSNSGTRPTRPDLCTARH